MTLHSISFFLQKHTILLISGLALTFCLMILISYLIKKSTARNTKKYNSMHEEFNTQQFAALIASENVAINNIEKTTGNVNFSGFDREVQPEKIANVEPIFNSKVFEVSEFHNNKDLHSIAGDDITLTQLDLARAYIELGKKNLAKQILERVLANGTLNQQKDAEQLISIL